MFIKLSPRILRSCGSDTVVSSRKKGSGLLKLVWDCSSGWPRAHCSPGWVQTHNHLPALVLWILITGMSHLARFRASSLSCFFPRRPYLPVDSTVLLKQRGSSVAGRHAQNIHGPLAWKVAESTGCVSFIQTFSIPAASLVKWGNWTNI